MWLVLMILALVAHIVRDCLAQDQFSSHTHRRLGLADETFDFQPFRDVIAKVVNKPYDASQRSIKPNSTSFDCVYPARTIIFTYSTHYTRELILMQHQALETSGLRSCLEEIMVTLCLDKKCVEYCEENNIKNVALVEMGSKESKDGKNSELPPSDFNKGEYRFLTYLKQELFYEALKVADSFFFMDVDCLLFKNPYIEIQHGRDELGHKIVFEESMSADYHQKDVLGSNAITQQQVVESSSTSKSTTTNNRNRRLGENENNNNSDRKGPAFIAVKKNDPSTHPDGARSLSKPGGSGPGVSERKRLGNHAELQAYPPPSQAHSGGNHRKNLKDYNYPDRYGYDLMYQRDRGRTLDCTGSVNTGQVYMRNSTRAQLYFKYFHEIKGMIMEGKNGPEQDHVYDASRKGNMRICSLTPHLFTAHCYIDFGNIRYINNGRTPIKDIISYHASCVEGLGLKKRRLTDVMNAVKAKSGEPMSNYL